MNVNQLNCFIAAAQYLNFTEAANDLHLVQSAVSYNISELEKELGVQLFLRDRKCVKLTVAGSAFLEDAFRITSQIRQSVARTQRIQSGATGVLKVAYVFAPIVHRFKASFASFQAQYPSVKVAFNAYDSISIARLLETDDLDVGFARYITLKNTEILDWRPLYKEPLCVVVSHAHHLCGKRHIEMDAMQNEPLILMNRKYNPGMFDMAFSLCMNAGFTPDVDDTPHDIFTVTMLVEMSAGYTILPACWKNALRAELDFIEIRGDMCSEVGIAWKKQIKNQTIPLFLAHLSITP